MLRRDRPRAIADHDVAARVGPDGLDAGGRRQLVHLIGAGDAQPKDLVVEWPRADDRRTRTRRRSAHVAGAS